MNYQAPHRGRSSRRGPFPVGARLAGTVMIASFLVAGCSSAQRAGAPSATTSTAGSPPAASLAAGSGRPRKILVIMEENHSIQQIFPSGMPYLWDLAQRYAYATDWSDVAHPRDRRVGVM